MAKRKLTVRRGDQVVAVLDGDTLTVTDICSLDGATVDQLVVHGVPVERESEGLYWRVQQQDPDFVEALRGYVAQLGLTVE
jgi:hypothetical protein